MRWALLFLLSFYQSLALSASACQADRIDQTATVKYNYDGDTLTLSSGQKIRVIGIDTPELANARKPNRSHQDLAIAAKQYTKQLIQSSRHRIQLRYDTQTKDKYGRQLAHVFLSNGQNLSALLLKQGLATHIVRPPNLGFLTCYQEQEASAHKKRLGIWALKQYQTISSTSLTDNAIGFRLVTGNITRITQSKKALLIELQGKLTINIMNKELPYFTHLKPDLHAKQGITIKGWLHKRSDAFFMRLYHPAALQLHHDLPETLKSIMIDSPNKS